MTIEADPTSSTVYIDDLNATYPAGSDMKKEGDNHLRLTKKVLKNTLPNITEPVTATAAKLNLLTPGYLEWSDTVANTGQYPLRLDVSDATDDQGCYIKFDTAAESSYFGLRQETAGPRMITATPFAVHAERTGTGWDEQPIRLLAPAGTYAGVGFGTTASGGSLRWSESSERFEFADYAGTGYEKVAALQFRGLRETGAASYIDQGLVSVCSTAPATPGVGIGGTSYGGILRVSQSTGRFEVVNGTSSAYQTFACLSLVETSDAREKENLVPIAGAVDKVLGLAGYTFTRKGTGAPGAGVLAQDLREVLPEAVSYDGSRYSVEYAGVTGLLVEAVKELTERLAVAEARIAKLERGV